MKYNKIYRGLLSLSAFILLKGDSCDGEVKSEPAVQCSEKGDLLMELGRGDCLGLVRSCSEESANLYSDSDFLATADWNGVDWVELRVNEESNYEVCVADNAPLEGNADGMLTVSSRGMNESQHTVAVGVSVLGWDFHVEAPSLESDVVEADSRFRVQSIVIGRSGIVNFDFRTELISSRPCDEESEAPVDSQSNMEWSDKDPEQYWATLYVPANAQVGCHRIYGIVTSKGAAEGKADFIDVSVRPRIKAVIDYIEEDFKAYSGETTVSSHQSFPVNVSADWEVLYRSRPDKDWKNPEYSLIDGGRTVKLDYILAGTYRFSLTVTDVNDSSLSDETATEIIVEY